MGGGDNEITISAILDTVGFQRGSKELQRAITGITSSVKRMAASIIGAASVYQVLSKAVSTYMSQNQKLSAQMGAVWTALGNVLGPIINQLIGWVTTAVSYLLEFLRLLGLTGKTASQLSKAVNKAGGDLRRTIAGFDELNVLSKGGGGGASGTLEDVDLEDWMAKLMELIKGKKWDEAAEIIIEKLNGLIATFKKKAGELGDKIGEYFGGIVHIIARVLDEVNWAGIGEGLGDFFMGLTKDLKGEDLGKILVSKITIALKIVAGFLSTEGLGKRIGSLLVGAFTGAVSSLAKAIQGADWKGIGVNIRQFFEKLFGSADEIRDAIFLLIKEAWDGFLNLLWGLISGDTEEEPPLIGALRKLGESVAEFADALKTLWDEKIEPTLSALFNWAIDSGLPAFFESLADAFSDIAKVITGEMNLTEFIANMSALEGVLVALAAIKAISGLTALYGALAPVAAMMPTIAPLVVALGALAIAIKSAAEESEVAAKGGFVDAGSSAQECADNVQNLQQAYADVQAEVRASGVTAAEDAELMRRQREAAYELANAKEQLAQKLGITVDQLNEEIKAADGDISKIASLTAATEANAQATEDAAERIRESTSTHTEAIEGVSDTSQEVKETFGENVEEMADTAETELGRTETTYEETGSRLVAVVKESSGNMKKEFESGLTEMGQEASQQTQDMNSVFETNFGIIESNAYVWGSDMMIALNNGIVAAFNAYVMPTIQQVAEYIRQYLGFSEPEKGPLSDFHTYGPDMMKLYAEGIEGNRRRVINAVSDVADGVSDAMSQDFALDKISVDFDVSMNGFADKIVSGFESLIERLQVIAENVAFQMPAVAGGGVVPYGVYGGSQGFGMTNGNTDVMGLINQLSELITDFRYSVEHMQWIAKFGNIQAVVQEISRIQKQNEKARG